MKIKILLIITIAFILSSDTNIEELITIKPKYHFKEDLQSIENIKEFKEFVITSTTNTNIKFTKVVDNYYFSDVVWRYKQYNNRSYHLGNDYETDNGANIYAPLSCYIIKVDCRYKREGFVGCPDGYFLGGGGNEFYAIAQLENKIYGFIFMHCKDILVVEGQFVKQGSVIAHVGNTGNTNSNHLHLEMYYLGDGDILDYISKDYLVDFNTGRGIKGYQNRCSVKDYASPCILDSREFIK